LDKAGYNLHLLKILAKAEMYTDEEGKWLRVWQQFFDREVPRVKVEMLGEGSLARRIEKFDLGTFVMIKDSLRADLNYELDIIDDRTLKEVEVNLSQRKIRSYNLANNFENHLDALALRYEREVAFGIYSLDYVVHYGHNKKICVEIDGPSHFICPSMRPTQTTLAKRRIL